ncbi:MULTISPECIES: hypothetical protein [Pseudomonas]|uniref:hypothetical protein n=1 Tax=Pseudomonas TaxID=286 RepID=UPI000D925650|nr:MULTISPECIES: hypothetical protein [Pseudomonas]PYD17885.1 hypothetical protein DND62_00375 [Pseudomonas syringae pv. pisi]
MNKSIEFDIPLGTLVKFKFKFEGVDGEKPISYSASSTATLNADPSQEEIQVAVNAAIKKLLLQQASENGWGSDTKGGCEIDVLEVKQFNTKIDATFR